MDSQPASPQCLRWVIRVDFAIPAKCPLSGSFRTCKLDVANRAGVILAQGVSLAGASDSGNLRRRQFTPAWLRSKSVIPTNKACRGQPRRNQTEEYLP